MTLKELNQLTVEETRRVLQQCCAAGTWVTQMVVARPYRDIAQLLQAADSVWSTSREPDWLEAFSGHPPIGDLDSLSAKFAHTKVLAAGEQAVVAGADEPLMHRLAEGNRDYLAKFGFIFIVCASGKSAAEILGLMQQRQGNSRHQELIIAAAEQHKITRLRLQKLLSTRESL